MPRVNFAAPTTVDEAVGALAGASGLAKVLSGGTDLLVQLRSGRMKPDLIVDTKKIPGIIGIREEGGGFVVGAATPGAMVEAHARHTTHGPAWSKALDLIGSTQIQGRCLARRQSVQRLAGGRQRAGADRRAARPPSSPAQGPARGAGRADRHRPGAHLAREGRVHPRVQAAEAARRAVGDAYLRFIPRTEMDIAVVGCGVSVTLDDGGVCTAARVVAGRGGADRAAGPDAAEALVGHTLDDATLAELDAAAQRGLQADQRQARHDRIPHQGRRRAGTPGGGHRLRSRRGQTQAEDSLMSKHHVSTTINGEPTEFLCETQQTLLDVLRDVLA